MTNDANESETYGDYSVDDEDQLQPEDTLEDGQDPVERGFAAPDDYSAGQRFGKTPFEEERGETFAQRLRQEEPETGPHDADGPADPLDPETPAEEDAMHVVDDQD
jgi:hypothetical protein